MLGYKVHTRTQRIQYPCIVCTVPRFPLLLVEQPRTLVVRIGSHWHLFRELKLARFSADHPWERAYPAYPGQGIEFTPFPAALSDI